MKNNRFLKEEAKEAYQKITGGLLNYFTLSKNKLKSFEETQKKSNALTQFKIGIQEIPLKKIVGSVQKNMDFNIDFIPLNDIIEKRWCNIYVAYCQEESLPPIEVYKIKDEYFVVDGNHRVSVAKALNFLSIEAIVTEFLPNTPKKEDILYNEQFFFEQQTNLSNINIDICGGYNTLKNIILYSSNIFEIEENEKNLKIISEKWWKKISTPILKVIGQIPSFSKYANGNILINILGKSTKEKTSFLLALFNYIEYMDIILNDNIRRQLKKLDSIDSKRGCSIHLIEKLEILEKEVGIRFETPLNILKEIEKGRINSKFSTESYTILVKEWYKNNFLKNYSLLENKIRHLDSRYKNAWTSVDNIEKLTLELLKYKEFYIKKENSIPSSNELIFGYILDIYIPAIDLIHEKYIVFNTYYPLCNSFYKLYRYSKKTNFKEALDLLFKENPKNNKKYYKDLFSIHLKSNKKI